MATNVVIPAMGESITEAVLVRWIKGDGDSVRADEPICELETDKANLDLPAPVAGILQTLKPEGESVRVGETIARIDESADTSQAKTKTTQPKGAMVESEDSGKRARDDETRTQPEQPSVDSPSSSTTHHSPSTSPIAAKGEGLGVRGDEQEQAPTPLIKTDKVHSADRPSTDSGKKFDPQQATPVTFDAQGLRRVPMSKIRKRIAERLVTAKRDTAMLTTFNEIDMSTVLELRNRYKSRFEEAYGVSLGLMSFFASACVAGLRQFPALNAQIEGNDIVYHQHVNLGIAVSTDRGLVVPILHNVDSMTFGRIEAEIKRVAIAAREGKLSLPELSDGTFTITNGGTFGSLFSTPILNPPQSGILGMHTIQKRPVVVDDRIDIRPMMYLALTYDHRLVDGSDSVRFLVRVKELIEDPSRLLLGI